MERDNKPMIDDGLDRLLVSCSLRQEWAELLTSNWWELLLPERGGN